MGIKKSFENMIINTKEEKIRQLTEEITGKKTDIKQEINYDLIKNYRTYRIKKILLISSSFEYFLLEEEGRLSSLFTEWCSYSENNTPPVIIHVETIEESLDLLDKENFDLVILFYLSKHFPIGAVAKKIGKNSNTPLVVLSNKIGNIQDFSTNQENVTKFFTWNGDGKIILSMVQFFEDMKNIQTPSTDTKRVILLVEDSVQYYSSYLSLIHEEIYNFLKDVIQPDLNFEQKNFRYKRRPFILHTSNYKEAEIFYENYKNSLICVITDNYLEGSRDRKPIGVEFAKKISKEKPELPVLIQSSEPIEKSAILSDKIRFISKKSPGLFTIIKSFIHESIGPRKIIISDEKNKKIHSIKKIKDLEFFLNKSDNACLKNVKRNIFSIWLKTIGEFELAKRCSVIEENYSNEEQLKSKLIDLIEDYTYSVNQASITSFTRNINDPLVKISRIGDGALGGKARGIAFLAKILSKYTTEEMFPGLRITIPRSIVLSTDIFDRFMEHNNLLNLDFSNLPDGRISSKFIESNLPATVLGDLRSFIRDTRKPLIVRSSGLLEDSLMQPFAGIYASMLLPNESWETDLRFQEVCNAIKYVYASTYFEKARTYINSTSKHIGDEKMSVLIQEVVGERHSNYFYPTISGVAKSYNYYPSGPCKPEEGIVYLALGLGKSIVDGGSSFAFCPEKPKAPLFGTPKDYMKYSQTSFYALNLRSIYRFVDYNEETSLDKLDLDIAKKHGVLDKIVSTYIGQDDRLYPGIHDNGLVVVDFAPVINYNSIPLAKAIKLLMKVSEISLGYPVEIEFAVNISKDEKEPSELIILQIRNMIPPDKQIDVNIDEIPKDEALVYSENILGNGVIKNLSDIIYVDQNKFDLSSSSQVVNEIKKINIELMEQNRPYILIGPGRWGSSDPWLGIPVIWSDIAGAKVIIETPYKERHIDPSQGSHFFHDMIASQVGYLITKKHDDINHKWFEKQKISKETEYIKHIKTKNILEAIIDSKKGKAIIREMVSK